MEKLGRFIKTVAFVPPKHTFSRTKILEISIHWKSKEFLQVISPSEPKQSIHFRHSLYATKRPTPNSTISMFNKGYRRSNILLQISGENYFSILVNACRSPNRSNLVEFLFYRRTLNPQRHHVPPPPDERTQYVCI